MADSAPVYGSPDAESERCALERDVPERGGAPQQAACKQVARLM